eukprot:294864-Amphidinium_carterae.2
MEGDMRTPTQYKFGLTKCDYFRGSVCDVRPCRCRTHNNSTINRLQKLQRISWGGKLGYRMPCAELDAKRVQLRRHVQQISC